MKKIALLILTLCFVFVGCDNKRPCQFIEIEKGYKLVSAQHDSWLGEVQCFVEKADANYVPREKELVIYDEATGEPVLHFIFNEKIIIRDTGAVEDYLKSNGLISDEHTVIRNDDGSLTVKMKRYELVK